jgi:hypothetical protein
MTQTLVEQEVSQAKHTAESSTLRAAVFISSACGAPHHCRSLRRLADRSDGRGAWFRWLRGDKPGEEIERQG